MIIRMETTEIVTSIVGVNVFPSEGIEDSLRTYSIFEISYFLKSHFFFKFTGNSGNFDRT